MSVENSALCPHSVFICFFFVIYTTNACCCPIQQALLLPYTAGTCYCPIQQAPTDNSNGKIWRFL